MTRIEKIEKFFKQVSLTFLVLSLFLLGRYILIEVFTDLIKKSDHFTGQFLLVSLGISFVSFLLFKIFQIKRNK